MRGIVGKFLLSTFAWVAVLTLLPVLVNLLVLPSLDGFHDYDFLNKRFISAVQNPQKFNTLRGESSHQGVGKRKYHHYHARNNHDNQNDLHEIIDKPPEKGSPYISYVKVDLSSTNDTHNAIATRRNGNDFRLIYFLHIHKSGGSCMCEAARRNHMRTNPHNCNVQTDQRCCGGNDSLEAQQMFARHHALQYSFVANEGDMYRAMDAQNYRYVVMLRDSQSRYKSHWQHVFRNHPNTTQSFTLWYQRQPDNWNLRKLCGTDCQGVPKYGITRRLFDETMERLQHFDHVLFLEDFNRSYTAFARQVNWKVMPVYKKPVFNVTYPAMVEDDKESTTTTPAWDPFMSALDDALYEIAKQRFDGQRNPQMPLGLEQKLNEYFLQGPMRGCLTPCCSQACSQY